MRSKLYDQILVAVTQGFCSNPAVINEFTIREFSKRVVWIADCIYKEAASKDGDSDAN